MRRVGENHQIFIHSIRDGSALKSVTLSGSDPDRYNFDGFSADGHRCMTGMAHYDTKNDSHTITVYDVLTGALTMRCEFNGAFSHQGTDSDSTSTASATGDLIVVSNPAGDVRLWKAKSNLFVGEIQPRNMTSRPPVHAGYDGPSIITCLWSRASR